MMTMAEKFFAFVTSGTIIVLFLCGAESQRQINKLRNRIDRIENGEVPLEQVSKVRFSLAGMRHAQEEFRRNYAVDKLILDVRVDELSRATSPPTKDQ